MLSRIKKIYTRHFSLISIVHALDGFGYFQSCSTLWEKQRPIKCTCSDNFFYKNNVKIVNNWMDSFRKNDQNLNDNCLNTVFIQKFSSQSGSWSCLRRLEFKQRKQLSVVWVELFVQFAVVASSSQVHALDNYFAFFVQYTM